MTRHIPLMIVGILLLPSPRGRAQEGAPISPRIPVSERRDRQASESNEAPPQAGLPQAPVSVTERLAQPYSIDLLPDEVNVPLTAEEVPATPPAGEPTAASKPWGQKTLTGDLFDRLFSTRDLGITLGGRVTQFGFGIAGGVKRPLPAPLGQGNAFTYTGRGEYDLLIDLEKFGGLPKGRLLIRLENWYGQYGNVSLRAGTLAPPVFPALLPPRPNDPGVPYVTNFLLTQPLSPNWVVFAGKKDVLGSFDQDVFAGGDGTDQFVNQALIANPAFLLGLPYSTFTTGFVSPRKWGGFSLFVMDTIDRTADFMQVGTLFTKGIIVGGEVKAKTMFFGLPGQQHVGAIWKHEAQNDLRYSFGLPGGTSETPGPSTPVLWNSYTLYYGFDQYLARFTENPDRGWGVFGRAALTDGNPNPVHYFLSAGLGGFSPLDKSRGDTFGLGCFLTGSSNQFGPVPASIFGPRNGAGLELFYNYQATPWLNITPDLQWVRPSAGNLATNSAFVYGLRINFTF